jgi:hypothetical protein
VLNAGLPELRELAEKCGGFEVTSGFAPTRAAIQNHALAANLHRAFDFEMRLRLSRRG